MDRRHLARAHRRSAGAAAGRLSDRWFQSFSIPGYSAYEANQRTLKAFGSGEQPPLVAVFTTPGRDVTTVSGIRAAIDAGRAQIKGPGRVGSWFDSHSDAYVSKDRHTMFATLYPPGNATFTTQPPIDEVRAALKRAAPPGVERAPHRPRRDLQVAGRRHRAPASSPRRSSAAPARSSC